MSDIGSMMWCGVWAVLFEGIGGRRYTEINVRFVP